MTCVIYGLEMEKGSMRHGRLSMYSGRPGVVETRYSGVFILESAVLMLLNIRSALHDGL